MKKLLTSLFLIGMIGVAQAQNCYTFTTILRTEVTPSLPNYPKDITTKMTQCGLDNKQAKDLVDMFNNTPPAYTELKVDGVWRKYKTYYICTYTSATEGSQEVKYSYTPTILWDEKVKQIDSISREERIQKVRNRQLDELRTSSILQGESWYIFDRLTLTGEVWTDSSEVKTTVDKLQHLYKNLPLSVINGTPGGESIGTLVAFKMSKRAPYFVVDEFPKMNSIWKVDIVTTTGVYSIKNILFKL